LGNIALIFGKIIANVALFITATNVNSACLFIAHQPELPEKANQLRKHS